MQREGAAWRYGAPAWLALLVLSTLTTKQHFFVDIAAGVLLAAFSFWMVGQWRAQLIEKKPDVQQCAGVN